MGRIIPQESATVSGLGSFDFQGHDAAVYADDQGHWVFLNQLCGYMGIDANNQRKRLIRNRWSKGWTAILAVQVPGDVQSRDHFLIHQRRLPMWLGSINTYAIKDTDVRRRVEDHQEEFAEALAAYVYEGGAINPRATAAQTSELKQQLEAMRPDADAWRTLASGQTNYSVRSVAAILKQDSGVQIGERQLFRLLKLWKWIYPDKEPYARFDKYVVKRMYDDYRDRETGEQKSGGWQLRVTVEGVAAIRRKLTDALAVSDIL